MVPIIYPSNIPRGVDVQSIMDATDQGWQAGRNYKAERDAPDLLAKLFGGGTAPQPQQTPPGAPQPFTSLPQFGATAPVGDVQRAPLGAPDPSRFAAGQGANTLDGNQIAGRFLKTVRDGGLNNPFALAAVASTGKHESGFSPQNAMGTWSDPNQSGQAGTAGGIMSWRGDRLAKLQAFAQQNGDNPNAPSPETQGRFLLQEDPSLIQRLQAAQSPAEAQQIMNGAWKFAGYDQPGGEAGQRIADAQAYAPQFGGGQGAPAPSQQALEGLAVGQSAPMGQGVPQQPQQAPQMPMGGQPAEQGIPQGGMGMPDADTMRQMFANPVTRPMAIELAKSRMALAMRGNDPAYALDLADKRVQLQLHQQQLGGNFRGDGLDAQAWNILQTADPSSKQYATAYAIVSQPKTQLVQGPTGMVPVSMAPNLPSWLAPPGGQAGQQQPGGPQGGAPGAQPSAASSGVSATAAVPGTQPQMNEQRVRNTQLYSVVKPELSIVEKTFPALADPSNQLWSKVTNDSDVMTTPEYQRARNSLKTIIASYLYSTSGATANPGEVENQASVLTPKFRESQPSIDDKLRRIKTMVDAIGQAANAGQPVANPAAGASAAPGPGGVVDYKDYFGGQ